jgi:hypothetical protein
VGGATTYGRLPMHYRLCDHAAEELKRRGIPRELLDDVMSSPQQVVPATGGRKAYQSKMDFGGGRMMMLRAIVDDCEDPPVVVTVYRTTKTEKYWSKS